MDDTDFAMGPGPHLVHGDRLFTIWAAGFRGGKPYVEIRPPDERVSGVVLRHLDGVAAGRTGGMSIREMQADL